MNNALTFGRKAEIKDGKVQYSDKLYLSYSAIDRWLKSPEQYMRQYFSAEPKMETPETIFGKKIAYLIETHDASMDHILQYSHPEYKIDCTIEGVPLFGFIDSFSPERRAFLEYKTGKEPWDDKRVAKHLQLDIYSLAIEHLFGEVDDMCHLIWMQTEKVTELKTGRHTHANQYGIRLTGEVQTFERIVTAEDRYKARETIVRVAHEIDRAYREFLKKEAHASKTASIKGGRRPA